MYTQPTRVNPALRAALDAASFLEQKANPIAPGPGGMPIKSVTGNLMDAMHQETASSPDEGMGDMGDMGGMGGAGGFGEGLQGILNNFRNAAPTLRENAENAQMDQIANKVAAKMGGQPQMLAHGGIAHGVDDMDFAEGGILGFAVGDKVPDAGELFDTAKAEAAAAREALYKYGSVQKQRDPEGFIAAQQRYEQAQAAKEQAEQAWRKQAAQMGLGAVQVSPGRVTHPQEPVKDMGEYVDRFRVAGAPAPAPVAARPPAAAAGAPSGGGGGMGGLGSLDAAGLAKLAAALRGVMPEGRDVQNARDAAEALRKRQEEQPLPGMEAMEALRKSGEAEAALFEEARKRQPMRELRALLSGIYRGGLGGGAEATQQSQEAYMREEAARIAKQRLDAIQMGALKDAQEAFRTGNKEKQFEAQAKLAKLATDRDQIFGSLFSHALSTMGHLQAANISAAASRENAGLRALMSMASKGPKLSFPDALKLRQHLAENFAGPMANQSPVLKQALALLKSPEADKLISDISSGRVKYEKDVGWGKHAPTIQRAEQAYKAALLSEVGAIDQPSGGATSYMDAFKDLGG